MTSETALVFDHTGTASLDGRWEFFPGDCALAELADRDLEAIKVPGLWEAQGFLELDGAAWYRRGFVVDEVEGFWTLRFGAVMDIADVYVNGNHVGTHDSAFTPFEFDVTQSLRQGVNEVAVRVYDPALSDPEHPRLAHGKQGWANHVFPSRPSLYMTYGGIWQSVTLRRHGPVVLDRVFVNSDPANLIFEARATNRSPEARRGRIAVRALALVGEYEVELGPLESTVVELPLGPTSAPLWSPASPHLHSGAVDFIGSEGLSDAASIQFGLRTVRVDGSRILLNGKPYRMKSVLVQGFTSERLYAESGPAAIRHEIKAAKAMGFNTLRLHIKAFDPEYLRACDELGMLVHSDIPIAEPIAHGDLGDDTDVADRCRRAAVEQVVRDRNHPSIILWSAMNELGLDGVGSRESLGYEKFARAIVSEIAAHDPTRPIIENDWVEPDPERVFAGDVLTAHWYGRLHSDYLAKIESKARRSAGYDKPLYITEFGDWGLPSMPTLSDPPFWDTHDIYATDLAATMWPSTVGRFVIETQRYQGLSDRLQIEVFRRHAHIGGYCLTELTDVPHELNGLLDLERRPKKIAVTEVTRANQTVLPMLQLRSLVAVAGERLRADLHIANDGPDLKDVVVEAWFGDSPRPMELSALLSKGNARRNGQGDRGLQGSSATIFVGHLPGDRPSLIGPVELTAPSVAGGHDLIVSLRSHGRPIAANRYPMHVVNVPRAAGAVQLIGGDAATQALEEIGARVGERGPVLVAESMLDSEAGARLREHLERGGTAVVLAQKPKSGPCFPIPLKIRGVQTEWGSSVFHFTTDAGLVPSLPRRNVLVAEDSTIQATSVVTGVGRTRFPLHPVVIAYKPAPLALTGTVIGGTPVGKGTLIFCQYRITEPAAAGDPAARAVLSDLIHWAKRPNRGLEIDDRGDGVICYTSRKPKR